jgi:cell division protein FtsI (penicillin-binding protein 3)
MDPRNGDLLALANWPTFDPNERVRTKADLERRHNYAISNLIEPGSTFKVVTISGAIEEGLATADELINCEHGSIYLGGRRIRDHKPFDVLTVSQVLAKSSNVGAIKLGMRLQPTRMFNYIERFGFGRKTGIELPGEIAGLLRPLEAWQSGSLPSISFGQEIGVTALQLARAVSAIANGGFLVKPRIVDVIVQPDGRKEHQDSPPPQQALSPTTSAVMRAMMEGVVREGTGPLARIPGYRIAGKTGTAQKIDPETGGYSPTDHIANFVGFVPVNDPSILMVIALDSPVGEHHGGQVAAPIFSRIASQALRFRDVPPELPTGPRPPLPRDSRELLADYERDESSAASWNEDVASQRRGHSVLVAALEAASQQAGSFRETVPGADSEVTLEVTDRVVPDLKGRTVREVIEEATALGLRVDLQGRGVALRQFPRAGTPIARGSVVRVDFRSFQKVAAVP